MCFKYLYTALGHDFKLLKCVSSSYLYISVYDTFSYVILIFCLQLIYSGYDFSFVNYELSCYTIYT